MSMAMPESRLPVGSSPSRIGGWQAIARAIATRCCSPPDSSSGSRLPRSASPTVARLRPAAALRSREVPIRARSSGSAAFSAAVRVGISWKNWKTIPIVRPRQAASCSSLISSRRWPATVTVPAVGRSMPAMRLMMVDLPLPDGPVTATISPAAMARSTPLSAGKPTFPLR